MTAQWPQGRPAGSQMSGLFGGTNTLTRTLQTAGVPTPGAGSMASISVPEERDTSQGSGGGGVRPWDVPPKWDGSSPETQLEPFLRSLRAWLLTTRVPARQQGVVLMSTLTGDLRVIASELEISEVTCDGGGEL
eukprot:5574441-Amphidinium_carterae.1